MENGYIRIGELSRRVGVSPELLRAWERRYGLLDPGRSSGRFRLYSDADVARVRAMLAHLADGLSAAEAARLALAAPAVPLEAAVAGPQPILDELARELRGALERFDGDTAHRVLDQLLAAFTVETVLGDVVLPVLRELGDDWAAGTVTVAQEHFASNLLRGRLLGLSSGWGRGRGPRAVLAAAPGEAHDLALVAFGIALHERGWRVTFLGADTPLATVADAAERLEPEIVVVSAVTAARFEGALDGLRELGATRRLVLAGAGASAELAERAGAEHVAGGPVEEAEALTRALRA